MTTAMDYEEAAPPSIYRRRASDVSACAVWTSSDGYWNPRTSTPFNQIYDRKTIATPTKQLAFAALYHRSFRFFFIGTILAMMADNIEHVVSYWLLFQKFHSPTLAGFAEISHWTPFLLLSVYFGGIAIATTAGR